MQVGEERIDVKGGGFLFLGWAVAAAEAGNAKTDSNSGNAKNETRS
jgi:hypothetical protein